MADVTVSDSNASNWSDSVSTFNVPSSNHNLNLSQQIVEVLLLPTSSNLRLSQQIIEALLLPTTANLRLSQQVIEVLYNSTSFDLSDSFTILDAVNSEFSAREITVSDELNYNYAWKDSFIYLVGLLKSVSSNLDPDKVKSRGGFRDAFSLLYYGADYILITDDISDIVDSIDMDLVELPNLGFNKEVSDNATLLTDAIFLTIDWFVEQSELITISDDFALFSPIPIGVTDSFTLADVIAKIYGLRKSTSDRIITQDAAILLLNHLLSKDDSFTISDAISLLFNYLGVSPDADSITFDDAVSILYFLQLLETLSDSFTLSDAVTKLLSTDLISYLRRYLNDYHNIVIIPYYLKVGLSTKHAANIAYLRRYLNDVAATTPATGDNVYLNDDIVISLSLPADVTYEFADAINFIAGVDEVFYIWEGLFSESVTLEDNVEAVLS